MTEQARERWQPATTAGKADWGPGGMDASMNEFQHQSALVGWCDTEALRDPRYACLAAVPNGYNKSKAGAGKAKAEGLRKGFPDLIFPVPTREYPGLFLELKAKTGRVDPEQKVWADRLRYQGNAHVFVYGWRDARKAIEHYLAGTLGGQV